jgi:hypothetical protein
MIADDGPGRTLLIDSPAGFADVIRELENPTQRLTLPDPDMPMPDPDRIAAIAAAHGIRNA